MEALAAQASVPAVALVDSVQSLVGSVITGVLQGGVYALISMGLTLIFGVMNIINFAQAEFLMLGMYATIVLFASIAINPLLIFFLLVPLFFVVGAAIYRSLVDPMLDAPEDSQLILTFGLLLVLQNGALAVFGPNAEALEISYANEAFRAGFLYLNQAKTFAFVFAVGMFFALAAFLRYTELGRAIRATANNKSAAQYAGINVNKVFMIAFGIGITLTASAGALLVMYYPVSPTVGFNFIILMFVVVILGGLGSVKGAFVAGILIGIIEQVAIIWLPLQLQPSVAFVLFLLVVLVRPQGLYGTKVRGV